MSNKVLGEHKFTTLPRSVQIDVIMFIKYGSAGVCSMHVMKLTCTQKQAFLDEYYSHHDEDHKDELLESYWQLNYDQQWEDPAS